MMIEYRTPFTVSASDTDEKGYLKPMYLQKALMEASDRHSEELGCGWNAMRQSGVFWVVSRIRMRFARRPRVGEKLEIRTWPNPAGISCVDRNYRVSDAQGTLVAEGMSKWSMVDAQDGKLVRALDHPLMNPDLDYSRETVWELGFERFTDPWEEQDPQVDRIIQTEDIDANRHVNNTRYLLFAEEAAKTVSGKPVSYLTYQISYLAPLFEGEPISMRVHGENGTTDVEGFVRRDGKLTRSFRCKME